MNNFVIRHRKIINLQMLTILWAMVLVSSQVADGQGSHVNRVTITQPGQNKQISESSLHVSGDCEINDGSNIWVFHHQRGSVSSWMFQKETGCSKKQWQGTVMLGNQTGLIDIIVVTFSAQTVGDDIGQSLKGLTGDKLRENLKGETSDRATVTVRNVRE